MGRVVRRIWAVAKNENPSQGAFIIEELTELLEFERIAECGGALPIIDVNTFRNPHGDPVNDKLELARSTDEEKQKQGMAVTFEIEGDHIAPYPAASVRHEVASGFGSIQSAVPGMGADFADALNHASYRLCASGATFEDKRFARKATAQKWKPVVKVLGH